MDAVDAWIDEAKALGRPIPPPSRYLVAASNPATNLLRCPRR